MGSNINSIIAQGPTPIAIDPLKAQKDALTLRNLITNQQVQQQELQKGTQVIEADRLKNVQTAQDQAADQMAAQLAAQNTTADPSGQQNTNWDAVTAGLNQAGFSRKATAIDTERRANKKADLDAQKVQIDNAKTQLENAGKHTELLANALAPLVAVNPDGTPTVPDDQIFGQYQQALMQATKAASIKNGDVPPPEWFASHGGAAALRQFLSQQSQSATSYKDQIDAQKKHLDYLDTANTAAADLNEKKTKTAVEQNKYAATLLSATTDQAHWNHALQAAQQAGVSPQVLAQFGPTYSPEAAQQAGQIGQTLAERETARHNLATEKNPKSVSSEDQFVKEWLGSHPGGNVAQAQRAFALNKQLPSQADPTAALDRESARFAKPHDKAVSDANTQLEKIADARAMINGSAEAQALGLPKVLTALVSGQGSGVRITQAEMSSIAKARGIGGDIEGFISSVSGKGKLTDTQKQQLSGILDDVKARVEQKRAIASDALDKINSASSRDEIMKHDKEARQKLSTMESAPAAGGKIRVKRKSDGATGSLDPKDFDPAKYDKL